MRGGKTVARFGFRMKMRQGTDRSRLLVTLSTKDVFLLFRQRFEHDAMFVMDSQTAYYVHNPDRLADVVAALADHYGYETVAIMGGSKAGYGALLVGGLLAKLRPALTVRILAFQARTHVWPFEPRRIAPGYVEAYLYAAAEPERLDSMRRYGDAAFVAELPNVIVRMIYSERNRRDRREALRLKGPNVSHVSAPTGIHNAMALMKLIGLPEAEMAAGVDRLLPHITEDEHRRCGGVDAEMIRRDVAAASGLPPLAVFVDRSFGGTPKPVPDGFLRASRARRKMLGAWRWFYWTFYASFELRRRVRNVTRRQARRAGQSEATGPDL